MLFNNLLSCHLATCGNYSLRLSLALLGNHVRQPLKTYPPWLSIIEQDELFVTSDNEGLVLLERVAAACSCFLFAVGIKLRGRLLFCVVARWLGGPGEHKQLALACSRLLSGMAIASLVRAFFLMLLVDSWDLYKCPRALAVASACLRSSTLTHIAMLAMSCHFAFRSSAVRSFTFMRASPQAAAPRTLIKRVLLLLLWLFLTLVSSSPSVLLQVAKSVPGLLKVGKLWRLAIDSCAGAIQGLLGSIVMPSIAQSLTTKKHGFTTIANLLMSCVIPAAVIVYLDTGCLANWVGFWAPCRENSTLFQQYTWCDDKHCGKTLEVSKYWYRIKSLSRNDICDPHEVAGMRSISRCVDLAFLRLQDIWLQKLIIAGLVIPTGRIILDMWYEDIAEGVAKLVILLAFALLASSHLPIVFFLLLPLMLSELLVTAVSLDRWDFKMGDNLGFSANVCGTTTVHYGATGIRLWRCVHTALAPSGCPPWVCVKCMK